MTTTPMTYTLAEFGAALDAHAGCHVPFAETVLELAAVRARKSVLEERRKAVFEVIKLKFAHGDRVASGGIVLTETQPAPVRTVRAVRSADIQKHDKKLWEAAKVAVPHVQVKPPIVVKSRIHDDAVRAVGALPGVPRPNTPVDAVVRAYQSLPLMGDVSEQERDLADGLRKIGANHGWDGLPISFTDGWTVGLDMLKFDSDRLREIAPEVWEKLAQERELGGGTRVYLGKRGAEDAEVDGE